MIFQNPFDTLNPSYSVGSQIVRTLERFRIGANNAERRETMLRLLDLVKLPRAFAARSPRQLSGGQKQRIGVARAFAGRPRVIIADEPMSALDVSVQAAISELLMSLQRESKTTMVFISHDLSVVRYLADRVVVMYLGHIVEMGATEQIFTPPVPPLYGGAPVGDSDRRRAGEEAPCGARGRDPLGAVAAEGLSVPDPLRPQARGSRRFVRARDAADPRRSPRATRSSAICRSRRSSAWSRCSHDAAPEPRRGADLAERACRAAGASDDAARSLARATVSANAHGKGSSGFSHLMDYLTALRAGRIVGDAEPLMTSPAPAAIHCDARGGIAQLGFDLAFDDLRHRARDLRPRALHPKRKLHHRRTRLLPAPSGGSWPRRLRRDQRTGADDRARRQDARLLHQSARLRRAARRWPAAAHRPGFERDRLRRAPALCRARREPAAGLGCRRDRAADHRSAARRCGGRCWRSAARAAPISR